MDSMKSGCQGTGAIGEKRREGRPASFALVNLLRQNLLRCHGERFMAPSPKNRSLYFLQKPALRFFIYIRQIKVRAKIFDLSEQEFPRCHAYCINSLDSVREAIPFNK